MRRGVTSLLASDGFEATHRPGTYEVTEPLEAAELSGSSLPGTTPSRSRQARHGGPNEAEGVLVVVVVVELDADRVRVNGMQPVSRVQGGLWQMLDAPDRHWTDVLALEPQRSAERWCGRPGRWPPR